MWSFTLPFLFVSYFLHTPTQWMFYYQYCLFCSYSQFVTHLRFSKMNKVNMFPSFLFHNNICIGDCIHQLESCGFWRMVHFVFLLLFGGLTLFWFCISHVLENMNLGILVGDIVVLPITLVAISAFANELHDDLFRFSRSIIFFTWSW